MSRGRRSRADQGLVDDAIVVGPSLVGERSRPRCGCRRPVGRPGTQPASSAKQLAQAQAQPRG
eukprot:5461790-Heterocapsa_arctica.AAC.1